MKRLLAITLALLSSISGAFGATKKPLQKLPPKAAAHASKPAIVSATKPVLPFTVQNTQSFFQSFAEKTTGDKKDEFETEEQFRKRQPHWNSDKILYFKVEPNVIGAGKNIIGCNYKYDIDHTSLTLSAGQTARNDGTYNPSATTRICISQRSLDEGSYEASNAYNAKVTVKKDWFIEYVLFLTNLSALPDGAFDPETSQFKFDRLLSPDEAREQSQTAEIYVGVQLFDYDDSVFECIFTTKPTIDDPTEVSEFRYGLKAKVIKVILWDTKQLKILKTYEPVE